MKKKQWAVDVKIDDPRDDEEQEAEPCVDEYGYEVSVVYGGPRESWGWGGTDKIVLFSDGLGGTELDIDEWEHVKPAMKYAKAVARMLCEALNTAKVVPPRDWK